MKTSAIIHRYNDDMHVYLVRHESDEITLEQAVESLSIPYESGDDVFIATFGVDIAEVNAMPNGATYN